MYFSEFDRTTSEGLKWEILSQVSRPSRYSGSEFRNYEKSNWNESILKICLAFPDLYEIGMSYYGFQVINSLIKSLNKSYLTDRVYAVWDDFAEKLKSESLNLYSTEQVRSIKDFDIIGFTLPHEAAYTNVLSMLNLGGMQLKTQDRSENDPLIIAGGYGAYNPLPMSEYIDVFCVGEAEAILPELLSRLEGTHGAKLTERINICKGIKGVYIPSIDGEDCIIERQIKKTYYMPESMIVPSSGIVHDRAAIELFRGCGRGCRFCQAGMVNRPVRETDLNRAKESILKIMHSTGWDEAGLLSLSSCDYSHIEELIDVLKADLDSRKARLSLPSLRMDGFSVGLAQRLSKQRRGGITFAPEAGTQRLRDVINKGLTEENINGCLEEIFTLGWDRVKLYFMMGLPTETEDDLKGINEIANTALKIGRKKRGRNVNVSVSVSGFVPKAHTPFQWERQNSMEELLEKGRLIKHLNRERAITINYHEPKQTFLEGLLSRGDKDTGKVIEQAYKKGAEFDNWTEKFNLQLWLESFEDLGIDPYKYTRQRDENEKLPWEIINVGVSREFLIRERHKAYKSELTEDCRSKCSNCGLNCMML